MQHYDFIILGAGLSGLACARTLQKEGLNAVVFEAGPTVGGRIQSRITAEGFVLDEGFQVLLSSYPELAHFVETSDLKLKMFSSGAFVFTGKNLETFANPLVHPGTLFPTLIKSPLTTKDKFLILKLIVKSQFYNSDAEVLRQTTDTFLKEFGFSREFIEIFWRPFLTGIFLDPTLRVDAGYFLFLINCFCGGKVSLPEKGMNYLPLKIAGKLKAGTLFLNQEVKSWDSKTIHLVSGDIITADTVICAFDPGIKSQDFEEIPYQSVQTFYFTSPLLSQTGWGKWLILIPRQFGFSFDHMTVLSETAPSYGPQGPLLSVSVVGEKKVTQEIISAEVNQIAKKDLELRFLERIEVKKALPALVENSLGYKEQDGVVYCGDRWTSASINGALRSGRLAAEEVLRKNSSVQFREDSL